MKELDIFLAQVGVRVGAGVGGAHVGKWVERQTGRQATAHQEADECTHFTWERIEKSAMTATQVRRTVGRCGPTTSATEKNSAISIYPPFQRAFFIISAPSHFCPGLQLAAAVPVDIMPGACDPANFSLPQQVRAGWRAKGRGREGGRKSSAVQ